MREQKCVRIAPPPTSTGLYNTASPPVQHPSLTISYSNHQRTISSHHHRTSAHPNPLLLPPPRCSTSISISSRSSPSSSSPALSPPLSIRNPTRPARSRSTRSLTRRGVSEPPNDELRTRLYDVVGGGICYVTYKEGG